jgi:hypothetical protein
MSDRKPGTGETEGLLARWSARKAKVRQAERALEERARQEHPSVPEQAPVAPGAGTEPQTPLDAAAEPEPEPADEDMPPIESLNERSDLSMFFSSKVSEELRRRALRKVFMSAAFNRVDGLDDYAEDFTRFETLGDVMTSDLKHRLEMARQRMADVADAEHEGAEVGTEVATAQPQSDTAEGDSGAGVESDEPAHDGELKDPGDEHAEAGERTRGDRA